MTRFGLLSVGILLFVAVAACGAKVQVDDGTGNGSSTSSSSGAASSSSGAAGAGGGSPSLACKVAYASYSFCADFYTNTPEQLASAKQLCSSSVPIDSCPVAGALGRCSVVLNGVSLDAWMYTTSGMSVSDAQLECEVLGGTWNLGNY